MTKKEIQQQEILKRKEERRIAKENKDHMQSERAKAWIAQQELWAQKKQEKIDKATQEAKIRALIIQRKHTAVFNRTRYLLEYEIPELIFLGDSDRVIKESLFFEIRNASFSLTAAKKYSFHLPCQGKVLEHINGRTNIGIYCAWLVLTEKIKNWEDVFNFLLRFGCWIKTTKEFNNHIEKFQNQENGAISADVYMREYETCFNYKFSDEERKEFSKRFLHTEYGIVTRDMVIDAIRKII